MKIGFWGSGNMARVLGGAWSVAGHQVVFGSRSAEKSREVAEEIRFTATGETNDEVAESCEVIVSTVRAVPSSFLTTTSALAGKVIIDLNNRDFPREYKPEEFLKSLAEATQKDIPSARVVKALNNQAMEVFNCDAHNGQFVKCVSPIIVGLFYLFTLRANGRSPLLHGYRLR